VRGSWSIEYSVGAIAMLGAFGQQVGREMRVQGRQDLVRDGAGRDRETGPGQDRRGDQQGLPADFAAVGGLFDHGRGFADGFDAIHQHVVDGELALEQDVQGGVDGVLVVGLEQLLQLRIEIAFPGPFFNAAAGLHDRVADTDEALAFCR
jgi:hypothetical protein